MTYLLAAAAAAKRRLELSPLKRLSVASLSAAPSQRKGPSSSAARERGREATAVAAAEQVARVGVV